MNDTASTEANMDAAIASGAHAVLVAVWGQASNPANFDTAYDKALAAIPDGPAKDAGITWGKRVADAVLAAREVRT